MSSPSTASQNVTFPRKLYDLINNEPDHLIEWAHHGESFFIRDQDEFSSTVLAKYFRHTKLTSFQRQLNLYGFRRITKGPDTGAYTHPLFSRDDTVHLETIKRVARKGNHVNGSGGASGGERWQQGARRIPTGVSPNSPVSFPDSCSPSGHSDYGARPNSSSWSHPGSGSLHNGGSTTEDEDEDEDEGDETYHPSGRRRRPQSNSTYSKPYYTRGGSSNAVDVPSEGRPHRYRTRRASSPEPTEQPGDNGVGGHRGNGGCGDQMMSQSAPNHPSSGWIMDMNRGSLPPPPPPFGVNPGQSKYPAQAQPGSPQSYAGPQSYPPRTSGNSFLVSSRSSSAVSDMNEDGGGPAYGGSMNGGYGGEGAGGDGDAGGSMASGGDFFDKPALAMATTHRVMSGVSLGGSDSWQSFGGGGGGGGSALDLDALADLDEFNFETSFMMDL